MSKESVDRMEIVSRIYHGPAPTNEATAMIGAMVSIIESDKGHEAAMQILEEFLRVERKVLAS
jgi:hypothetical protein